MADRGLFALAELVHAWSDPRTQDCNGDGFNYHPGRTSGAPHCVNQRGVVSWMRFKSNQPNPTLPPAMKTKLMLTALLAFASLAQAGPPMTPAKIKRPLRLSQVTSIFAPSAPSAPVQPATASVPSAGGATTTVAPVEAPVSKKVHLNTFLNHPVGSAGPK